jgi:hypothetical protein
MFMSAFIIALSKASAVWGLAVADRLRLGTKSEISDVG